jgi:drug/metabolite transporter (DMT)-like permease
MLFGLAALWGASFMFIKIGDRELHPITLVGFRMALGALTLVPIVLVTVGARQTLRELRGAAGPLIFTGLLNSAIPIFAITWAETRLDSGLTAIIQASAPLFTALLALRFSQDQRVGGSPRRWRSSSRRFATRPPASMRAGSCAAPPRS